MHLEVEDENERQRNIRASTLDLLKESEDDDEKNDSIEE